MAPADLLTEALCCVYFACVEEWYEETARAVPLLDYDLRYFRLFFTPMENLAGRTRVSTSAAKSWRSRQSPDFPLRILVR